jgi:putative CocE/NonD family hydrolase
MELTGPITCTLYAASTAVDTDFTAKLVDVRPDGYAHNLQDGIVRARFRTSVAESALIRPGRIYKYEIDLWSTSHVLFAGHRLRLEISSSNFPRFDRNPNTGNLVAEDAVLKPALQTVIHNAEHPSHVTLPIVPR